VQRCAAWTAIAGVAAPGARLNSAACAKAGVQAIHANCDDAPLAQARDAAARSRTLKRHAKIGRIKV